MFSVDIPILQSKKVKSTGKEIDRGAYGRVVEVEYEKTRYAAKEVHELLLTEYAARNEQRSGIKAKFLNECLIWSRLQHPCIVQFIG